jgi:hypothetical protein
MHTRNALEHLAVAGRPLLTDAESLVDAGEEERILERILASPRTGSIPARRRKATPLLALSGIAVVAAVVAVAALELGRDAQPVSKGHRSHGLTGATIHLAGYRFRTPAGFKTSSSGCEPPFAGSSGPAIVLQGASAAASAAGGCVDGGIATLRGHADPTAIVPSIPGHVEPVTLSGYQGYLVAHAQSDGCAVEPSNPAPCPRVQPKSLLYIYIPDASDPRHSTYAVLLAQGLTKDQLIAVAESGLQALPPSSTTST